LVCQINQPGPVLAGRDEEGEWVGLVHGSFLRVGLCLVRTGSHS